MNLTEMFKLAVKEYIKDVTGREIREITRWHEVHRSGGCRTCSYDGTAVEVSYVTLDGTGMAYTYEGDFSELLSALTKY